MYFLYSVYLLKPSRLQICRTTEGTFRVGLPKVGYQEKTDELRQATSKIGAEFGQARFRRLLLGLQRTRTGKVLLTMMLTLARFS